MKYIQNLNKLTSGREAMEYLRELMAVLIFVTAMVAAACLIFIWCA